MAHDAVERQEGWQEAVIERWREEKREVRRERRRGRWTDEQRAEADRKALASGRRVARGPIKVVLRAEGADRVGLEVSLEVDAGVFVPSG